jgi:hypothetical protein
MVSREAVLRAVFFLILGQQAHAGPPDTCQPGHAVTITAKIQSVVARDALWSIWLNRHSTECSLAAVVVNGKDLASACRPGSRIAAWGTLDGTDTLRSGPTSVSCAP